MQADADFYLERLYPMQDRVLSRLAPIETGFYLTGGTAASRGYLHHRFSDDLDFFVNDRGQLTIHADRGPAMTSKSVALLLADLA